MKDVKDRPLLIETEAGMHGRAWAYFLVASVCKCKLKVKDNITRIKPESTNMLQHIGCVNITKQKWLGMALYPHVDLFTM